MKSTKIIVLLFISAFISLSTNSQTDTLHIYYRGLETKVLDSNETKIAAWAKSLNGKKVNIEVITYYHESQFKKYSQERADELFIILNRKARSLINITFIGPKKGEKSQRSIADIVYTYPGSVAAPVSEEKKKTEKDDKSKSAGAAATVVGAGVVIGASSAESASPAKSEKKTEKKAEKPVEKKEEKIVEKKEEKKVEKKEEKKSTPSNSKYDVITDTIYINGIMKINKRKVKK